MEYRVSAFNSIPTKIVLRVLRLGGYYVFVDIYDYRKELCAGL